MNLSREVEGKNKLNALALAEVKNVIPQLKKYIGKRICLEGGKHSSKFKIDFLTTHPPAKDGHCARRQRTYIDLSGTIVYLKMTICLNGGSYELRTAYTQYFETFFQIGKMENGILIKEKSEAEILEDSNLEILISETEEAEKIKTYEKLAKKLKKIERSLLISNSFLPKH